MLRRSLSIGLILASFFTGRSYLQADETPSNTIPLSQEASILETRQGVQDTLSPELVTLRNQVRKTLATYYQEPISIADHSPWGIMHALIAYGVDTQIVVNGKQVNAIGHMCFNQPCRGMQLMTLEGKNLRVQIGPGYQGHAGQFLAMLAQSRVMVDYPIRVGGREFTVADLIESEKQTCRTKSELTFKLIALSHYLPLETTWKNDLGENWSISRLIKEELAQNVVGAACGGTHRMTGFSYVVNRKIKLGEEFDGQFLRASKFVDNYHDYIFKLQNSDGSFSTNWFAGRGDDPTEKRRIETTGHMVEWLVCSLSKEELTDPRVVKAVDYLSKLLLNLAQKKQTIEIGPRGHALHGLAIYGERVFGDRPGQREEFLAKKEVIVTKKIDTDATKRRKTN